MFWRRRLAVLLVMAALVVAIKGLAGGSHAASETTRAGRIIPAAAVEGARQEAYVVKQGDTLWAIARRLQPDGDVRPMVDRLAALRRGEPLRVGERIVLPRGG